ncbi:MAG TPA: DUF3306 domain-containing protein [Albitalea sp.]
MSEDGFLSRWSRRKVQAKRGDAVPEEPPASTPPVVPLPGAVPQAAEGGAGARPGERGTEGARPEQPPPPTLDDAAALPRGADISHFMTPKVGEDVKRAALKKLFADPHFNVMDGLDTYIDDYSKPSPIPPAVLRQLAQAQALGLFEPDRPEASKADETKGAAQDTQPVNEAAALKASPDGASPAAVTSSAPDPQAVPPDENPDLRLQQDHAAGHGGAGQGPSA